VDELRDKKRHWVGMRDVVPAELALPDEGEDSIQVAFSVDGLNLQYAITVPPQATVGELALFVGESILKPLDEYDGYRPLPPGEIGLALRSDTEAILDPALPVAEIQLAPGDALVANVPARRIRVIPPPIPHLLGDDEGEPAAREPRLREAAPEREQDFERRVWERRYPFEPEMVFVPAGSFLMGTDRERLERAGTVWQDWMERETPYHQVTLPGYWIGRFPVTNAEYQAFVEDGGYRARVYWTEAGWVWKGDRAQLDYWHDEKYNGPQQPVVGVPWYEAVAYCRWLLAKTGREFRLPSEAEWEKAARGTDGRSYPWGDEFDESKCNVYESSIGTTTPVGKYSPQLHPELAEGGDSPYGCADMAGNVWTVTRNCWRWAIGGMMPSLAAGSLPILLYPILRIRKVSIDTRTFTTTH